MTDTDWSFSLRSATRFCDAPDSDDDGNLRDAGATSHLPSSTSILRQIDLAPREDSAQYKPTPWSIARINAATRSQRPDTIVNSVSEKPVTRKPPQGAIVDAFKRQAQKPTKPSAQANLSRTPSQNHTLTCITGALDNFVAVPARPHASTAHITTSDVNLVSIPSQPPITNQRQSPPLSSFLPRMNFTASYPGKLTPRPPNPHFAPNLKRVLPFSSPGPLSHPQRFNPSTSGPRSAPAHSPARFEPHILGSRTTTPNNAHLDTDYFVPFASTYQEGKNPRPSQPYHQPTPVKLERKTVSPFPGQGTRVPPRPWSDQQITKVSPKSEEVSSSPSFTQARRFFEHGPPLVTATGQPLPESAPSKEKIYSTPSPPQSYSRKGTDAYDQLPPSPDSEWSTLKPPVRKANNRIRPKAQDVKSGKFRLPLSFGTIAPNKPSPQKRTRVVTYLPPPPPKKPKMVAEPHPRTRTSGLPSPPPSDETAPPSSPTPSMRFDSHDVSTRYKIVRAKIRQVRVHYEHPHSLVTPFDLFLRDFVLLSTPVAEGA